nr:hypothetical protein [Tanacetum cinerariifolium]GEZ83157.1 hypothetical protein [Tanacetum cinerariifolium]
LGDPDQIMRHYKQAGSKADPDLIIEAKKLQINLMSQMDGPEVATLLMVDLVYGDEAQSPGDSMVSKSFKNKAAFLTRTKVVV